MPDVQALVTGATSGIGLATARAIHSRGGTVALLARNESRLNDLTGELGERSLAIAADVSDPAKIEGAVEQACDYLGDINLVVNSAGVATPSPLENLATGQWNETIAINLSGSFYVSRTAARRMQSGSIIRSHRPHKSHGG
jgi:NAD(P)-dependent dehydrogenase (short-subunit alcohol dehydrogenase family)